MIGAGGLFAPTIRHHDGVFYIVCTNVGAEGEDFAAENFLISTTDIWANDWSDPTPLDLHGIDPSLFVDEDGRAYIQGSYRLERTEQPTSTIKQYEIDLRTGARLSEIREIWPGYARIYTEGPHIYKKDGYYYLLVAEGGTFEHHLLSVARATDIWGPYESCPCNPILTAWGTDEPVQDAGHGEFFQDEVGRWWAAVLGVRKDDDRYPMGRESFLCPVEWPEGEWPQVAHPRASFQRAAVTSKQAAWWSLLGRTSRIDDCYIRSPVASDYRFEDGNIWLRAGHASMSAPTGTVTFVGKRQRSKSCLASAVLTCPEPAVGFQAPEAGLVVYKDDVRHAAMMYDPGACEIRLVLRNNEPQDRVLGRKKLDKLSELLQLYITASSKSYEFRWNAHGDDQAQLLGEVDTAEMSCRDFTGTLFGLHALCSTEQPAQDWVHFRDFTVRACTS